MRGRSFVLSFIEESSRRLDVCARRWNGELWDGFVFVEAQCAS